MPPKQALGPGKPAPAPDRSLALARKEAAVRIEELKLKILLLVERHFEQGVIIVKQWMRDAGENGKPAKK
jgi:hypothetical protein